MRKSTEDALKQLEVCFKAYKRWRWIRGILYDFTDAYGMPWSPVSAFDAPEIERLENKISAWEDKAFYKKEDALDTLDEIRKRFRRNKTVIKRYTEIMRYIAKIELALPDDYEFPDAD